jgi:transposase-like protein
LGANIGGREVRAGVLAELRNRGVTDVLIACVNGLLQCLSQVTIYCPSPNLGTDAGTVSVIGVEVG